MTAQSPQTPIGKDSETREPPPKRSRSASLSAARGAERASSATRAQQGRALRAAPVGSSEPLLSETKAEGGSAMETEETAAPVTAPAVTYEPTVIVTAEASGEVLAPPSIAAPSSVACPAVAQPPRSTTYTGRHRT